MEESLYIASGICLISGVVDSIRTKLCRPLNLLMITWGIAFLYVALFRDGVVIKSLSFYQSEYENVSKIAIPFCLWGLVGAILGNIVFSLLSQKSFSPKIESADPLFTDEALEYLFHKYYWLLYVSALIGIVRFFYLIKFGSIASFMDYRVAMLNSSSQGVFYFWLMRIGAHIYILTNFLLIVLGLLQGRHGLKLRPIIKFFILYSLILGSQGGRVFIIDFSLYFFISFFLSRVQTRRNFRKNEIINWLSMVISALLLSGIIGSLRSEKDKTVTFDSIITKMEYFGEGVVSAEHVMGTYKFFAGTGNGRNLFAKGLGPEMKDYYESEISQRTAYGCMVPSIIPSLYFDFGPNAMLPIWGILVFCFQLAFRFFAYRRTLISFFVAVMLCRSMAMTFLGNPIGTLYAYCFWIVLISLWFHFHPSTLDKFKKNVCTTEN